jgi:hypothetical protein
MGLYVTSHPLEMQREILDQYGAIYDGVFEDLPGTCTIAGLVVEVKTHESKKGQMAWVTVENGIRGMPRITIFSTIWKTVAASVVRDAVLVVRGVRDDHPRFGWGFKADSVRILDRTRPGAQLVRILMPEADILGILELAELLKEWEDEAGAQFQVVVDAGDRVALLSPKKRAILTGSAMTEIIQRGWDLQLDPTNPVISLAGQKLKQVQPFKGRSRVPAWEHALIRYAMERWDATFTAELGS